MGSEKGEAPSFCTYFLVCLLSQVARLPPAVWRWLSEADLPLPTLLVCSLLPSPVVLPWDVANTRAPVLGNPEKAPVGPPLPCSWEFHSFCPSVDLLLLSCPPENHSFLPALMPQYLDLSPHF